MRSIVAHEHPREGAPDLSFARNPERIAKEKQDPGKRAVKRRNFRVNGLPRLRSLLQRNLSHRGFLKRIFICLFLFIFKVGFTVRSRLKLRTLRSET